MKLKDSVKFREDLFFNGSVEIDCIYDDRELALKAANSYVFHSKSFFTQSSDGKLDTIGLVKEVFDSAYCNSIENPFITAIAGYGSGKSHLCTAIAALFGNNKRFLDSKKVLENINEIDKASHKIITSYLKKPNIVFAINGMCNVNLTLLLYNQLKEYLKISEVKIPIFTNIEIVYSKAKLFVSSNYNNNNFQTNLEKFLLNPEYKSIKHNETYIIDNITNDLVFSLVNEISNVLTGNIYQIENYLTPNIIIKEASDKLCGDGKPFDKIIIIFDELGRYIEWLAETRSIDPSSMQQLYEGIKNSNGKATFLSFIQFPISTYFNHLAPTAYASVQRYVDRYRTAKSYHLSTILETVFANLIEIKNDAELTDYSGLQLKLIRWNPELEDKFLWTDLSYYNNIICKRLKVFHPLTISLLAKLSEYTQKRGPLAILKELLDLNSNAQTSIIKSIVPINILHTSFKEDVLKMERSSLIKSNNVSTFDQLISDPAIKRRLSSTDISFLESILVINLLNLRPNSKDDYHELLSHLTGLTINELIISEQQLEIQLGIIRYDDEFFYHDIVIDAVGQKDFDNFFITKRNEIVNYTDYYRPEIISEKLRSIFSDELSPFKTSLYDFVKTLEWEFPQFIFDIRDDLHHIISEQIKELSATVYPNVSKGIMIWLYINHPLINDIEKELLKVEQMADAYQLEKTPIQIGIISDIQGTIYSLIIDKDTFNSFTGSDKERYGSFLQMKDAQISIDLQADYNKAVSNALYTIDNKLTKSDTNYRKIINQKVLNLYKDYIPFNFAGFNKKKFFNARNEIIQIYKVFTREDVTLTKFKEGLPTNTFNRFMSIAGPYDDNWKIFDDEELIKPKNQRVYKLFSLIDKKLANITETTPLKVIDIYNKLLFMPYGLNIYSANLLFIYATHFHRDHISFHVNDKMFDFSGWINYIHGKDIDFDLIKNTLVKFYDIRKKEDSVSKILQKILDADSILTVIAFSKENENLLNSNYLSEEVRIKLAQVAKKIKNAQSFNESYYKIYQVFQQFYEWFNDLNDGVPDILKKYRELIEEYDILEAEVNKGLFSVPDKWDNEFWSVISLSKEFVKTNFLQWFERNHSPSNHNVEGFISFNNNIVKSLYAMELNTFAKKVKDNIKKVESSRNLVNRLNERTTALSGASTPKTELECKYLQKEINDLINEVSLYYRMGNLSEKQKNEFEKSLFLTKEKINKQVNFIKNQIASIYDSLNDKKILSINDLIIFKQKVKNTLDILCDENLDHEDLAEIYYNSISIENDMREIEATFFDIKDVNNKMDVLRNKYKGNLEDNPEALFVGNLFNNFESQLVKNIERKISSWMAYLPNGNYDALSKAKLHKYFNYVQTPPSYIGENELENINKIKLELLSRLDDSIETEIISLFEKVKSKKSKLKIIEELKKNI